MMTWHVVITSHINDMHGCSVAKAWITTATTMGIISRNDNNFDYHVIFHLKIWMVIVISNNSNNKACPCSVRILHFGVVLHEWMILNSRITPLTKIPCTSNHSNHNNATASVLHDLCILFLYCTYKPPFQFHIGRSITSPKSSPSIKGVVSFVDSVVVVGTGFLFFNFFTGLEVEVNIPGILSSMYYMNIICHIAIPFLLLTLIVHSIPGLHHVLLGHMYQGDKCNQ